MGVRVTKLHESDARPIRHIGVVSFPDVTTKELVMLFLFDSMAPYWVRFRMSLYASDLPSEPQPCESEQT